MSVSVLCSVSVADFTLCLFLSCVVLVCVFLSCVSVADLPCVCFCSVLCQCSRLHPVSVSVLHSVSVADLQGLCQETLQDFNLCMFYEPSTSAICPDDDYDDGVERSSSDQPQYLDDDIIFKIIASLISQIHLLQKIGMVIAARVIFCWFGLMFPLSKFFLKWHFILSSSSSSSWLLLLLCWQIILVFFHCKTILVFFNNNKKILYFSL